MTGVVRAWLAAILLLGFGWGAAARANDNLLLFVAASTLEAMEAVAEAYRTEHDTRLRISAAASSTLARQIVSGAPADLFISANTQWMDYLENRKLLAPGSRKPLLGNDLVLIAPKRNGHAIALDPPDGLLNATRDLRLAIADPDHVPAGIYGAQALRNLGLWEQLADRLARAPDARSAVTLVARGEVAAGIAYRSDIAAGSAEIRLAGRFPAESHSAIVYPVAIMAGRDNARTQRLFRFLTSPRAAEIFRRFGFKPLP